MTHGLKLPVLFFIIIISAVLSLEEFDIISDTTSDSVLYACIISVLNLLVFSAIMKFSIQKSGNLFLLINLGGMGLRVGMILLLVFLTLKFLKIDEFEFIFTLFLLYTLFLVYEITTLLLKAEKKIKNAKKYS